MRYKLTKDLPTFKAGTPCHISSKGSLVATEDGIVVYAKSTLAKFPNILTEWFEPIPEKRKAVPEDRDEYYAIFGFGDVQQDCEPRYISQGNWRWTKEEAEAEVMRRAAIERVRRYLVENDLLEEDKTKEYVLLFLDLRMKWSLIKGYQKYYSPYGRVKNINTTQFLEDCREDLLLIHS